MNKFHQKIVQLIADNTSDWGGTPMTPTRLMFLRDLPGLIRGELHREGVPIRELPQFRVVFCGADGSINLIFPDERH